MSSSNSVLPVSRQPIGQPSRPIPKSPVEIEREMEVTAARLQENLGQLMDRVKPANVAARAKDSLRQATTTPDGAPKPEVIGAAVAGALGIAVLIWRSRRS